MKHADTAMTVAVGLVALVALLAVVWQPGGHEHVDDSHAHAVFPAEEPYPSVALEVAPDAAAGWNVHVIVENFAFRPELVNDAPAQGEGHAHLFVDGEKVARLYGEWYHLTVKGTEVCVTLNAHDHAVFAAAGEPVKACAQLR